MNKIWGKFAEVAVVQILPLLVRLALRFYERLLRRKKPTTDAGNQTSWDKPGV